MKKIILLLMLCFAMSINWGQAQQLLLEDFSGGRVPPAGWYTGNYAGAEYAWHYDWSSSDPKDGCARSYGPTSQGANAWLVSPVIELPPPSWGTPVLSVDHKWTCSGCGDASTYADVNVYPRINFQDPKAGFSAGDTAKFSAVLDRLLITINNWDWVKSTYDLSVYGGSAVQIAFQHLHTVSGKESGMRMDAITVYLENAPEAPIQNLKVKSKNSTSITMQWDNRIGARDVEYLYITYAGLENPISIPTHLTEWTLEGLTDGTAYDISVYIQYGTATAGEGPVRVFTDCYENSPEEDAVHPIDIQETCVIVNNKNATGGWGYNSGLPRHTPGAGAGAYDWFLTNKVNMPSAGRALQVSYTYNDGSSFTSNPKFGVYFVPNANDLSSAIMISPVREYASTDNQTNTLLYDLGTLELEDTQGRIGILAESNGGTGIITINSIEIINDDVCKPINYLEVANITTAGATIKLGGIDGTNGIAEVKISTTAIDPETEEGSPIIISGEDTYTASGLIPDTKYYFYARNVCDFLSGEDSEWTRTIFRTAALIEGPYREIISTDNGYACGKQTSEGELDGGYSLGHFSRIDGNGDQGYFIAATQNTNNCTGNQFGFRIANANNLTTDRDQWLVSPAIKVDATNGAYAEFYYRLTAEGANQISGWVSTDPTFPVDNRTKIVNNVSVTDNNTTDTLRYKLNDYKGQTVYVAFRVQTVGGYRTNVMVQGFEVKSGNSPNPPASLAYKIGGAQIDLSWENSSLLTPVGYNVKYSNTAAFNPNTEGTLITSATETASIEDNISAANDAKYYYIYVQADYGEGVLSNWSQKLTVEVSYKTIPRTIPFIEMYTPNWPVAFTSYANISNNTVSNGWSSFIHSDPSYRTMAGGVSSYYPNMQPVWVDASMCFVFGTQYYDLNDRILSTPPLQAPSEGALYISYQLSGSTSDVNYTLLISESPDFITGETDTIYFGDNSYDVIPEPTTILNGNATQLEYHQRNISLADKWDNKYAGKVVYIGFKFFDMRDLTYAKFGEFIVDGIAMGCSMPYDLQTEGNENSANITLKWASDAGRYEVAYAHNSYSPYAHPNHAAATKEIVTENEFTIPDMMVGESYYIWVRGNCADGGTTPWTDSVLIGSCSGAIAEYPYVQDFETMPEGLIPANTCWSVLNGNILLMADFQVEYLKAYNKSHAKSVNTGSGLMKPGQQADNWLISPRFEINDPSLQLTFDYWTTCSSMGVTSLLVSLREDMEVRVSTTTNEKSRFTRVLDAVKVKSSGISRDYNSYYTTYTYMADLSEFENEKIYIAIVHKTKNDLSDPGNKLNDVGTDLYIDNFVIKPAACPSYVQNVEVIPSGTPGKVLVKWEGDADEYIVRWTSSGHSGTTTPYNGYQQSLKMTSDFMSAESTWDDAEEADGITGTEYEINLTDKIMLPRRVYVAAKCSGVDADDLSWIGPIYMPASLSCDSIVSTYPWTDDCDSWNSTFGFTNCWEVVNVDNDRFTFHSKEGGPTGMSNNVFEVTSSILGRVSETNGWHNSAVFFSDPPQDVDVNINEWLISRPFNVNVTNPNDVSVMMYPFFDFWIKFGWENIGTFGSLTATVYVGNSNDLAELRQNMAGRLVVTHNNGTWQNVQYDIGTVIANAENINTMEPVYVAINCTSPNQSWVFSALDDFRMRDVSDCPPAVRVRNDSVETTRARISWDSQGPESYDIRYGLVSSNFNPSENGGTLIANVSTVLDDRYTHVFGNLTAGNTYKYYIKANCVGIDDDAWVGPFEFKTDCNITTATETAGYSHSFGSWTNMHSAELNTCWTVIDKNNDGYTFTGTPSTVQADNGARIFFFPKYVDSIDEWMVSVPLDLDMDYPVVEYDHSLDTVGFPEKIEILVGRRSEVRNVDGTYNYEAFEVMKTVTVSELNISESGIGDYAHDTVYIVLRMASTPDTVMGNTFYLHNMRVYNRPPCDAAVDSLEVVPASETAFVTWKKKDYQSTFEVQYWKVEVDADTISSRDLYGDDIQLESIVLGEINPLEPETLYGVRVRAICEGDPDEVFGPWEEIFFETRPLCEMPENLTVTQDIEENVRTVTVSWESEFGHLGFEFEYGITSSASVWSETLDPDVTSISLPLGLDDEIIEDWANYTVRLSKICTSENTSRPAQASFTKWGECSDVENMTETPNINSAMLKWDAGAWGPTGSRASQKYEVWYKAKSTTRWLQQGLMSPTSNTANLNGLTANTVYEWYVIAECESGNRTTSPTKEFTTRDNPKFMVNVTVTNPDMCDRIEGANDPEGYYATTSHTITAIPKAGYAFDFWTIVEGGQQVTDNPYTIAITENHIELRATFRVDCIAAQDLQIVSEDPLTLSWRPGVTVPEAPMLTYNLYYKLDGPAYDWEDYITTNSTSWTNTGIAPGTYQWYVETVCSEDISTESEEGPKFTIGEPIPDPCHMPTALLIVQSTKDTVHFGWTPAEDAPANAMYEVAFKLKDATDWEVMNETANAYIYVHGLEEGIYTWRVRMNCRDGEYSDYAIGEDFEIAGDVSIRGVEANAVEVSLLPNPANDYIRVDVDGVDGKYAWQLIDINGRILQRGEGLPSKSVRIDVGRLSNGNYLLKLQGKNWERVEQFIKQN